MAKSGYRSSVKIRARSASTHAGRVRLALSRAIRSESPSAATPQSAAPDAFRYSWSNPKALLRRRSSPSSGRGMSRPVPTGATTTGTRSPRAKNGTGYARSPIVLGSPRITDTKQNASRRNASMKRSASARASPPAARPASISRKHAWAMRQLRAISSRI